MNLQDHDAKVAETILAKVGEAENFIGDKGYDSESIREYARAAGMNPTIPRKSNSTKPNPEFDSHLYKSCDCLHKAVNIQRAGGWLGLRH